MCFAVQAPSVLKGKFQKHSEKMYGLSNWQCTIVVCYRKFRCCFHDSFKSNDFSVKRARHTGRRRGLQISFLLKGLAKSIENHQQAVWPDVVIFHKNISSWIKFFNFWPNFGSEAKRCARTKVWQNSNFRALLPCSPACLNGRNVAV